MKISKNIKCIAIAVLIIISIALFFINQFGDYFATGYACGVFYMLIYSILQDFLK